MKKLELWYPIKNPFFVTQKFGENLNDFYATLGMKGHNGWDIVGNTGQLIRAAHDGIITFAGEDGSSGLGVVVRTNEQYQYNGGEAHYKSIYWHCKAGSIRVRAGDFVKIGDVLAECDTTGKATGSHLHFGLKPVFQGEEEWNWWNAEQDNGYFGAIDPAPYWNGYYAENHLTVIGIYNQLIIALSQLVELLKIKGRVQ